MHEEFKIAAVLASSFHKDSLLLHVRWLHLELDLSCRVNPSLGAYT